MTMLRPSGTLQQEYSLAELEHARSAELETRVAGSELIAAARAATHAEPLSTRVRRAIAWRLRRS
ncbi:MAG: hypothetical protein ACYDAN_06175 [Candidatus Limnocylindrales bacterium]